MKDKIQLCDKCASEPITFEALKSHHLHMTLKWKVDDLKRYVEMAIENNIEMKKTFPESFSLDGMGIAYEQIQEKLNEI